MGSNELHAGLEPCDVLEVLWEPDDAEEPTNWIKVEIEEIVLRKRGNRVQKIASLKYLSGGQRAEAGHCVDLLPSFLMICMDSGACLQWRWPSSHARVCKQVDPRREGNRDPTIQRVPGGSSLRFGSFGGSAPYEPVRFQSLLFLRERLSLLLDKTVQGSFGKSNSMLRIRSAARIAVDYLHCSADCTLGEFSALRDTIHDTGSSLIQFDPKPDEGEPIRVGTSKQWILFSSFKAFCDVIGESTTAERAGMIIKQRKVKGKRDVSVTRVIGGLLHPGGKELSSVCVTPGFTYSADFTDAAVSGIPALFRQDATWDAVEQSFYHPLQCRELDKTYLKALINEHYTSASIAEGGKDGSGRIRLGWRPLSKPVSRPHFAESSHVEKCPGVIDATIPVVLFHGAESSKEVSTLLTPEVLKQCVQ